MIQNGTLKPHRIVKAEILDRRRRQSVDLVVVWRRKIPMKDWRVLIEPVESQVSDLEKRKRRGDRCFGGRLLGFGCQPSRPEPVVLPDSGQIVVEIDELYLAGALVSYRNIVDTEEFSTPFADFAPRILLYTDLPEVAASLATRRVCLALHLLRSLRS